MFGGSTQSSGALELLRFISLGPLGSQGLPVMKGMLRKEFFFFFPEFNGLFEFLPLLFLSIFALGFKISYCSF